MPRIELAREFLSQGNPSDAILAAEAAARLAPQDSEAWRVLGELHASQDADAQAILCFEKSHEADPYNQGTLLSLGVALANEMDSFRSLVVLRRWLRGQESFFALVPPGDDYLSVDNLRGDLETALTRATLLPAADADVWAALGVVKSVGRDFLGAAQALHSACLLRPEDAFLWNRLGATLANGGKSALARDAYAQALRLRPAFARALSNLGVAHANLGEQSAALGFFLAGLRAAPRSENLWSVVFMTLANFFSEREDLGRLSGERRIEELGAALGGIPASFPADCGPEEALLRIGAEFSL